MLGWFWLANVVSDGTSEPLPYVPLINPLELGLLFALFGVYVWSRSAVTQLAIRKDYAEHATQLIAGASLFVFFTALVMRTAHHWGGVPFELDALLESMLVQAGLSIVWTLMALSLMIGGHLRHRREVWLIGAALIGVVVAKLFFVELSNRGGLAGSSRLSALVCCCWWWAISPRCRPSALMLCRRLKNRPRKPKECRLESEAEPCLVGRCCAGGGAVGQCSGKIGGLRHAGAVSSAARSGYRLELPLSVQLNARQTDLSDVRVLNAAGEAQASLARAPAQTSDNRTLTDVKWFPLYNSADSTEHAPSVRVQSSANGTLVKFSRPVSWRRAKKCCVAGCSTPAASKHPCSS